jgi:hypothetical protein
MQTIVGDSARSSARISGGSNDRATSVRAPTESEANVKENAAACESDVPGRTTSVARSSIPAASDAIVAPAEAKVWVTPFGRPVLPEVKKIMYGAPGEISGSARVAGSRSRRSSKRSPSPPPYQRTPYRSPGTRALAATSRTRSACASSRAAPETPSAWSISGGA